MTSPLKVWITRTQPGAAATAERVRARGHEAFVAPLLEVRQVGGPVDLQGVGALAFTSANGVAAFAAHTSARDLPVYAVGAATAAAARAAGFGAVEHADGDVSALADALVSRREQLRGVVLHPGPAEPAGDLVGSLARHGVSARAMVVYETAPTRLDAEALARISDLDVVLIHSARAAKVLAEVLRDRPAPHLRALAISAAALRPLVRTPLAATSVAQSPLEADLLNLLDSRA